MRSARESTSKHWFHIFFLVILLQAFSGIIGLQAREWSVSDSYDEIELNDFRLGFDETGNPHLIIINDLDLVYTYKIEKVWKKEIIDKSVHPAIIKLDSDGNPHIIYLDLDQNLIYAYKNPTRGWIKERLEYDESDDLGYYLSMTIDKNNIPHVCYTYDLDDYYYLKYGVRNTNGWDIKVIDRWVKAPQNYACSIVTDSNNEPHIIYSSGPEERWTDDSHKLQHISRKGNQWTMDILHENTRGITYGTYDGSLDIDSSDDIHFISNQFYGHYLGAEDEWYFEDIGETGLSYFQIKLINGNPRIYYSNKEGLYQKYKENEEWSTETIKENSWLIKTYVSIDNSVLIATRPYMFADSVEILKREGETEISDPRMQTSKPLILGVQLSGLPFWEEVAYLPDSTTFTVKSFLENQGFTMELSTNVFGNNPITLNDILKYDAILLPNYFFEVPENLVYQSIFIDYVNQGGGLILLGQNSEPQTTIDEQLGFHFLDTPHSYHVDANIVEVAHPIIEGISQLPKSGGVFVDWDCLIDDSPLPLGTTVIARSTGAGGTYSPNNKIALIAFEYGQGRVVVGPYDGLNRPYGPTNVDGFNVISEPVIENQLFLNAIDWVSGQTSTRSSPRDEDEKGYANYIVGDAYYSLSSYGVDSGSIEMVETNQGFIWHIDTKIYILNLEGTNTPQIKNWIQDFYSFEDQSHMNNILAKEELPLVIIIEWNKKQLTDLPMIGWMYGVMPECSDGKTRLIGLLANTGENSIEELVANPSVISKVTSFSLPSILDGDGKISATTGQALPFRFSQSVEFTEENLARAVPKMIFDFYNALTGGSGIIIDVIKDIAFSVVTDALFSLYESAGWVTDQGDIVFLRMYDYEGDVDLGLYHDGELVLGSNTADSVFESSYGYWFGDNMIEFMAIYSDKVFKDANVILYPDNVEQMEEILLSWTSFENGIISYSDSSEYEITSQEEIIVSIVDLNIGISEPTGGLTIIVRDEFGNPVRMARIICVKQPENENRGTSLSANDGRYDPINLSHGTYAFEIEKEGYKTEYIECLLEFGEHPFIEIVLREKTFVDHIIDNFMYLVVTLVVIIFIILITKK